MIKPEEQDKNRCPICNGDGVISNYCALPCPACGGTGTNQAKARKNQCPYCWCYAPDRIEGEEKK